MVTAVVCVLVGEYRTALVYCSIFIRIALYPRAKPRGFTAIRIKM